MATNRLPGYKKRLPELLHPSLFPLWISLGSTPDRPAALHLERPRVPQTNAKLSFAEVLNRAGLRAMLLPELSPGAPAGFSSHPNSLCTPNIPTALRCARGRHGGDSDLRAPAVPCPRSAPRLPSDLTYPLISGEAPMPRFG